MLAGFKVDRGWEQGQQYGKLENGKFSWASLYGLLLEIYSSLSVTY